MIKTKHYATFYSPGTFFPEISSVEIDWWSINRAVELSKEVKERYDARPYAFRFSSIVTADPIPDEQGGFLEVEEREEKSSGLFFLGGKIRLYDEVLAENNPDEQILRTNMECNQMWVILENTNSWRFTGEFKEEDVILNGEGQIIRTGKDADLVAYRFQMSKKEKEPDEKTPDSV